MNITRLIEKEVYLIIGALRIAAEQYVADSRTMTDNGQPGLAAQFLDQHEDALALADRIEENAE